MNRSCSLLALALYLALPSPTIAEEVAPLPSSDRQSAKDARIKDAVSEKADKDSPRPWDRDADGKRPWERVEASPKPPLK